MPPSCGWPPGFWQIPYVPTAIPGAAVQPSSWLRGSNCQRFAYGVLSLFNRQVPPLRSSELWDDTIACSTVDRPQSLDLVFYGPTANAFGAHVGVWFDHDSILHLCAEVGIPAVWDNEDFARRSRYAQLVGFKRVHPCKSRHESVPAP